MTAFKRTIILGRQAIPPFADKATLIQMPIRQFISTMPEGLVSSPFNIAMLGFWSRGPGRDTASKLGVQAYSFWSWNKSTVPNVFDQTQVPVPPWAEYFSVSWLTPSLQVFSFMFPEDFFYIRWGLSI